MTLFFYSCIVKVTFFDEFAEYVDQALKQAVSHPVTIIIGSAKLGRFQGTCLFLQCLIISKPL